MSWRSKSYEELPALSVRGEELRRSLRVVTLAWMYGIVWMSCVSGSHVKIFARMLGFNNFHFGLLTAMPYVATVGQLFAAILIERSGLKKYQFVECGTIHRLLWLGLALIPLLLPIPSALAVAAMLVIMGTSWFANALATPAIMTWLGDLVPKRIRGRYFANRFMYARPIQITVVLALGVVLNLFIDSDLPETRQAQPVLMWVICIIFTVAALFGAADILLFRRVREVVRPVSRPRDPDEVFHFDAPRPAWWNLPGMAVYTGRFFRAAVSQLVVQPLQDRVFRNYVAYGTTLAFAVSVPGWFFWRNATENLGFSPLGANFLFLVVSPVLGLIGAKWWGKALDRWGRRPVLIVASMGTWLSVLPWFLATRHTPSPRFLIDAVNAVAGVVAGWFGAQGYVFWGPDVPLGAYLVAAFASVFGGIAWTGVQLAQNNVILGFSDGQGRSKYIAASSVLISLGGILGGLFGGVVAQLLEMLAGSWGQTRLDIGPLHWNQWHATFAISFVTRLLAVLWLVHMPDPGAATTRAMIRHVSVNVYNAVSTMLFYPLRVFGWGRGEDPE